MSYDLFPDLNPFHLDAPRFSCLKKQLMQLVSNGLTLREDVAKVLCTENIPDKNNIIIIDEKNTLWKICLKFAIKIYKFY